MISSGRGITRKGGEERRPARNKTGKERQEQTRERERERERTRPFLSGKKSHRAHVIPALPLLLLAPGARARYPGRSRECMGVHGGRGGGGVQDEHTHLRWAEQRYITRAPRDTSPAGSLSLPLSLSTSLFRFSFCRLPRDLPASLSSARPPHLPRLTRCVVSLRASSWVDRSPRPRPRPRNKVRASAKS